MVIEFYTMHLNFARARGLVTRWSLRPKYSLPSAKRVLCPCYGPLISRARSARRRRRRRKKGTITWAQQNAQRAALRARQARQRLAIEGRGAAIKLALSKLLSFRSYLPNVAWPAGAARPSGLWAFLVLPSAKRPDKVLHA